MRFLSSVIAIFLLTAVFVATAEAQYNNEWIEYGKAYYKFKVPSKGIYRIPYSTFQKLNTDYQVDASVVKSERFVLFQYGQPVPIYFHDINGNNLIDAAGEYLEFYARDPGGELDAHLYSDPSHQPNPYLSLFRDSFSLYLTWDVAVAGKFFDNRANNLNNLPQEEPYHLYRVEDYLRLIDAQGFSNGKPAAFLYPSGDPVYESAFALGEGYGSLFGSGSGLQPLSFNLAPAAIYTGNVNATLNISAISISNTPHRLVFSVNNLALVDTQFTGFSLNKFSLTVPNGQLASWMIFKAEGKGTGSVDRNVLCYAELIYPRQFIFSTNESKVYMTLIPKSGERYVKINAFNFKNTDPILYDLTNNIRIVGSQSVPLQFKLPAVANSGARELLLTSQSTSDIGTITSMQQKFFVNYLNPGLQGDYIIISHSSLRDDGNGNDYVSAYAKYRESQEGGGHEVALVDIDELYDQFAFGVKKHPLAIRNFISYAIDNWSIRPQLLFLIGKGREYPAMRIGSGANDALNQCLIPTFGTPGSDILLAATNQSIVPRVAVGRLSVDKGSQINDYLEKVKAYEFWQQDNQERDPHQTIAKKEWMKRVLHMGGGEESSQQARYRSFLENYKNIIEDTLYGAKVYSFYKTTTTPIEIVQSDFIRDLINSGVSLITFFGHSSANSFDIAIDDPDDYRNFEKYPIILSNGCYTGNIFNPSYPDTLISEDFVLTPRKAAIAFVSTIGLSSDQGLNRFSEAFYRNIGYKNYHGTLGGSIKGAINDIETIGLDPITKAVAEEMTLHGDPGLKINPHAKPDYVIEPQTVFFDPPLVNANLSSFDLKVVITNLGKATHDSLDVVVSRTFPNPEDGSVSYVKRIRATLFRDTVVFTIPTGDIKAFGLNRFCVKVDPENGNPCIEGGVGEIAELSETNNELLDIALNITSSDAFPIQPYEFAIVPTQPVTLYASTATAFGSQRAYLMEIDTTELFNSPVKKTSAPILSTGGLLQWTPPLTLQDSVVYYWRVGPDPSSNGGNQKWNNSSFIYLKDEYPGWNQSHYYQFLKDGYTNMYVDNDRQFKFVGDLKTISVKTGTATFYGGSVPADQIAYHMNDGLKHRWNCGGTGGFDNGIVIAVFDSLTGEPWVSKLTDRTSSGGCSGYAINQRYGNIHCKFRDLFAFDFPTAGINNSSNQCYMNKIVQFLDSVPNGFYILAYSVNRPAYSDWIPDLVNAFRNLGSTLIDSLACTSCNGSAPWVFFTQKGNPSLTQEKRGYSKTDILTFSVSFTATWNRGKILTPAIGPATEWHSAHWKYHHLESPSFDNQQLRIIGLDYNGLETEIYRGMQALDTMIDFIQASMYPFIKLELDAEDDSSRTPSQLDYWRILYKKVPEAALSPNIHFSFNDTLNLGDYLNLSVAITNVTDVSMDSLLVKYTLLSTGKSPVVEYVRYDSLRALQTMQLNWSFNTDCDCLGELNTLIIEANPDNDQPEQFHYNNIGILTFGMGRDKINPILDVTFDGIHIMDGDIVSARPEIQIMLKDENPYLLLDTNDLIHVIFIDEQGNQEKMQYDGVIMKFYPSISGSDNTARVVINKTFDKDGVYTMLVQAKDRSRNISGTYGLKDGIDYRISFEVINESTISHVLNYPNPFTSSTRFVFTLTGSRPPDFFKIQILTVSGKVVRELTQAELGPIRVGRNITEYAWDGTDAFGDPLANGLYLYRVVAKIDGEPIKHRSEAGIDKYFHRGFGKMYLAR
ncbi:MAG: hypothetical protein KatS3mg031_1868 [Chitinophagales bacterium]|nr:MAG: hypothetical protein KatS3mg031_1868 [Chitinophagales bacterium]